MATHSSTLAWQIPWTEEPVGCSPWGRQESDTTEATQQQQQQETLGVVETSQTTNTIMTGTELTGTFFLRTVMLCYICVSGDLYNILKVYHPFESKFNKRIKIYIII